MHPTTIPLQSNTVTVSDTPTVQIWASSWLGAMNLIDMPQVIDTVTISESPPILVENPASVREFSVTDTATVTDDAPIRGLILPVSANETMTISESPPVLTLSGTTVRTINVNDPITLTDPATPNLISEPLAVNTVTVTETFTVEVVYGISAVDTVTLTDPATTRLLLQPQAVDTVTLTDPLTITGLTLLIAATNTITLTDSAQGIPTGTIPFDNFDDNSQSTGFWEVAGSTAPTDARVLVSETNHQLRITPFSNAGNQTEAYNGYRAVYTSNYTNTSAFAEVPQVASGTTVRTSFHLSIDVSNGFDITHESGQLYLEYTVGNSTTEQHIPYDASQHRWWRIRHVSAGDTIRFDTSVNGTVWTEQLNIPRPAALPVSALRIGLEAGTYDSVAIPGVAIFDNVNSTTLTAFPVDSLTVSETNTTRLLLKPTAVETVTLSETRTVHFKLASSLIDDFDDNTQNTALWTKQATSDPSTTDALVTVLETSQQLQITPRSSFAGVAYNGYRSVSVYDLTDSAFFVKVEQVPSGATIVGAELIAALDTTNNYVIYYEAGNLDFGSTVAGVYSFTRVTYNSSMHRWWRIRHDSSDNTIHWETSTDGNTWTSRRTPITAPFAITALRLGVDAGTYDPVASPGVAIFDSFNIPGPSNILAIDDPIDTVTVSDVAELELISPMSDTVTIIDGGAIVQLWVSGWFGTVDLLEMPHAVDTVTISEAPVSVVMVGGIRTINVQDTVTLTDPATVQGLILGITVQDTVTPTDVATVPGFALQRTVTDTQTVTDTLTVQVIHAPFVTDTITLTDPLTITLVSEPQTLDTLSTTDVVTVKGLIPAITAVDTITLTDPATITGLSLPVSVLDTMTVTDDRTVLLIGANLRQMSVEDTVTLTDTATVTGLILKASTVETQTMTDTPTVNLVSEPSAVNTVTLTDTASMQLLLMPQATNTVTLTDVVTVQGLTLLVSGVNTITVTDQQPNVTFGVSINRTETMTVTDQITVRLHLTTSAAEILNLGDTAAVWAGFRGSNLVTVSDYVTIFTIGGIVTEPTVVIESEVRDLTKVVEVSTAAVPAALRDLTHVAATSADSVTADVRDLTKTVEVSIAQVVAEVRDLSKVA